MTRQSERLEAEAEAARQRLSLALDELRVRLTPADVLDQLAQSGTGEFFANFARDLRDNPLSVAFFGASLALLLAPRIRDAAANAVRRSSEAARGTAARAQSATAAAGERAGGAAWDVSRAAGRAADTATSLGEAASTGYRRAGSRWMRPGRCVTSSRCAASSRLSSPASGSASARRSAC
ncbi:MAG TPA: hypothetical protein VM755_01365 [Stellaceae bacterium]|nr:hypothetical protein [Stellaceae bacterium]